MSNLINIHASTNADIVGDDAQPTLRLSSTSTGPGIRAYGLVATSTASIDLANIPTLTSAASNDVILTLQRTVVGTYSSIFVASPLLLYFTSGVKK